MLLGSILGWLVAGLVVGAVARALMPGREKIGIAATIGLGIVGAIVGGFISSMMFGPHLVTDGTAVYAVDTAWPGWIMAIVGGVLVLWLALTLSDADRTNRLS